MPETADASQMTPEQIMELQKQKCPFCQIIKGQIPTKKVYEDDKVLAILDINPISKGHILLMPKEHYPIMPIIPENTLSHLFKIAKHLSHACLKKIPCQGTNIFIANGGIAGQTAYHFMVFIIPRDDGDNISNFSLPKNKESEKESEAILPALKNNINIILRDKLLKNPIPGRELPKVELPKISEEQLLKLIKQNPQLKQVMLTNTEQFKQLISSNFQLKAMFEGKDIEQIVKKLKDEEVSIVEPVSKKNDIEKALESLKISAGESKDTEADETAEKDDEEEKQDEREEEKKEDKEPEEKAKGKKQPKSKKGIDLDAIADLFS